MPRCPLLGRACHEQGGPGRGCLLEAQPLGEAGHGSDLKAFSLSVEHNQPCRCTAGDGPLARQLPRPGYHGDATPKKHNDVVVDFHMQWHCHDNDGRRSQLHAALDSRHTHESQGPDERRNKIWVQWKHCALPNASASRCQAKPSKPGHTCKRAARTRSQDAPIANRPADVVDSMAKGLRVVFWQLERSLAAVRLV